MRHQLRIIPQLTFYLDDTLDYVFKIEKLLDDIKKESDNRQQTTDSGNTEEES
jgi:ribosome-binding factor A